MSRLCSRANFTQVKIVFNEFYTLWVPILGHPHIKESSEILLVISEYIKLYNMPNTIP